ncbi:MAG: hypothetical protein NDI61_04290 [Bdellovibrionaceae bacterium]|nr:hypothetical protein [Pseudobdellovibrionaceae bacterium]
MSIFKKLLGRGKSERVQTPRPPRIRVTALHRVAFRHLANGQGRSAQVPISNVSTRGMGLLRPQLGELNVGDGLKGELEINQNVFGIEGLVRHLSEAVVGCEFMGPMDDLGRAVEEYFRIEICGLKLNRVDETFLKKDPAGKVAWFTDGGQNEVYFVSDRDGILSFHVSFLGNYIEGGRSKILRCGHIIDEAPNATKHKGSNLLDLAPDVSEEVLKLGHLLVDNVEKMPAEQAQMLKALLQKS